MKPTLSSLCLQVLLLLALAPPTDAGPITAFAPGERLEYVLKWSGIAAGDSVMEVVEGDVVGGQALYRVISTAESRSLIDIFYKVRNRYETHMHPADGLTRKYVFNMNEGGKHMRRVLIFDQERHIVTRIVREEDQTQSQVYEIPEGTHDNLSSLYAMRNETFKVGDSLIFRVFEGRKNWELTVDVLAEEEIEVAAGRFRTLKIHPKLKFEGIFRRKGDLYVWVTDDQRHMPVLMKSKVRIGSINAELVRYATGEGSTLEGPSGDPPD
ncbi:MAG: DUF3108 domain-containing protein [bacterium]|nr:MAG: DUF3108 domain-containing protein [bacterium]